MLLEKKIPLGYIIGKIKKDIFYVLTISVAFYLLKVSFIEYLPAIPLPLVAVLGTSISLILAFRINQSYDRWWEARKVWGAIVNDSRSLIMQASSFIHDDTDGKSEAQKMLTRFAHRQIAWGYCLGQALRGTDPLAGMGSYLAHDDFEYISGHINKPNALLMLHAQGLKEMRSKGMINDLQQIQLDSTLVRLCDSMGKCERINSTVFPRTYSLIVHFFIYMFVVILSLGLVESVGPYEIPMLTVIASAFFLIEKTGIHMQDPFKGRPTDTAVTAIARTIEINIRQLMGENDVPQPITATGFYLL
jgi:putative membrane protein